MAEVKAKAGSHAPGNLPMLNEARAHRESFSLSGKLRKVTCLRAWRQAMRRWIRAGNRRLVSKATDRQSIAHPCLIFALMKRIVLTVLRE
jgi:hypothetical protein